ncbi:MAG TPA: thiamine pyrophosphate-dependent enzyme [Solirubrobacteraceae bacterium]|nr:thiamine pyrophosphate-dependent enzyme [Solirubrobacteraceae bacterium]
MNATVHPQEAADLVARAVARRPRTVALFAESSSSMLYATRAVAGLEDPAGLYVRVMTHYGSMGHAIGGACGFCEATGQRAVLLTGDGSLHLMSPLPTALKHGHRITVVVLNDHRLGLPYFGSGRIGALGTQSTTDLPEWDFTRTGSPLVGGRRVTDLGELEDALAEGLACDGVFVVDVQIDPDVVPPFDERAQSVATLFVASGA